VLHAFIDESGTHAGAPVVSVGGFWGSGNQWRAFRNSWKENSKGFHAKDSTDKFPALCRAIGKSRISGVLMTVGRKNYETIATPHVKTMMGNAYSACALLCAVEICERAYPQKVAFFIEQGQPNLSFVKAILEDLIGTDEWRVKSVTTVEKGDFIELHPSDFLSHLGSTHGVDWLGRLFFAKRIVHAHITKQNLAAVAPKVTQFICKARAMRRAERRHNPSNISH
jgi:hypothetical protein